MLVSQITMVLHHILTELVFLNLLTTVEKQSVLFLTFSRLINNYD